MHSGSDEAHRRIDRRTALTTLAAGSAAATSGCVRRVRSIVNRDQSDQLSVTIATVPSDGDREAVQIARRLQEHLDAVGVNASMDFLALEELHRRVLINHAFDIYVGRHPGGEDPDFLYEALHSVFADESGWQNPYGFTNLAFDDRLERMRGRDGEDRESAVASVLRGIAAEQPFVPLCRPDECRLVRDDRFEGWDDHPLSTRLGYLGLDPVDGAETLRTISIDARVSENLNPIGVEYRNFGIHVDLLYDSLATVDGDELLPWLAESWEWDDSEVTVRLRSDCRFHDEEPVTADDVAFTYRFLEDTSMGDSDVPSPSPRFRGRASAIDSIDVEDDLTLTLSAAGGREAAERAFTVPILPAHVWADRTGEAEIPGVTVAQGTTEAIVTDNIPPIGSGPFAFVERVERETVTLERHEGHFTRRSDVDLPAVTVDEMVTQIAPRSTSAIETIEASDADATLTTLETYAISEIPDDEALRLLKSPSSTFYHVGFNVRTAPFSNPYFRRIVAGLLDKAWIVDEIFEGYGEPIATPLGGEWVPADLEWDGADPVVPFYGSDGELNVPAAKAAFREAGFRYDDRDRLLARH